jgi:hypothetical protein
MTDVTGRFSWVGKTSRLCLVGMLVWLAFSLVATVALGIMIASDMNHWTEMVAPIATFVGLCLGILFVFVLHGLVLVISANEHAVHQTASRLIRIETLMSSQAAALRSLVELGSLSDRAKSLVYREQEIEAIREVVHRDLMVQDYRTAQVHIDHLQNQLGCVDEAARLQESLEASRKGTREEQVDAVIERIQATLATHDWPRAERESERAMGAFPDNPKIAGLPVRIEEARVRHKRDLLQAYGEATRRKDVDQGIELLRELDAYLTPQEAAALEDSARGVFKAKLHNLGVQFALWVTDKNWRKALLVGEQIIDEYPNTRMAQEVREKLDHLRMRAEAESQDGATVS